MKEMMTGALRLMVCTIVICSVAYPLLIWGVAQLCVPGSANGSIVTDAAGRPAGSSLVAQKFTLDQYFHCRPSAVDYNAAGAGGSNLSPASPLLRERAEKLVARYGATAEKPLPADLATASGSGLDPHISLSAAQFQAERIARTRQIPVDTVGKLISGSVSYPGGLLRSEPLVNVLELNLKLDALN